MLKISKKFLGRVPKIFEEINPIWSTVWAFVSDGQKHHKRLVLYKWLNGRRASNHNNNNYMLYSNMSKGNFFFHCLYTVCHISFKLTSKQSYKFPVNNKVTHFHPYYVKFCRIVDIITNRMKAEFLANWYKNGFSWKSVEHWFKLFCYLIFFFVHTINEIKQIINNKTSTIIINSMNFDQKFQ